MPDFLSPADRSRRMASVRSQNTGIELRVREALKPIRCTFTLHDERLPGCPDIVFRRKKRVIFAHGCFWHGHTCNHGKRRPTGNSEYWSQKIANNVARDRRVAARLRRSGWGVLTVWECESAKRIRWRVWNFLREKAAVQSMTSSRSILRKPMPPGCISEEKAPGLG